MLKRSLIRRVIAGLVILAWLDAALALETNSSARVQNAAGAQNSQRAELGPILQYISGGWDQLTRSMSDCASFSDAKTAGHAAPILYLPAALPAPSAVAQLRERCGLQIKNLPAKILQPGELNPASIPEAGLLYLPNPYVVPGGRFNKMYGWDSYFIIRGLLRDGRRGLARGMVENFFYEIENYGSVLNANRTYYLSRSQPPFLTSMILAVYEADKSAGQPDTNWLARAYGYAARDYAQWTQTPHMAGDTGLSRYFDHGDGPAPEVANDPGNYYETVAQYFSMHGLTSHLRLPKENEPLAAAPPVGPVFTISICGAGHERQVPNCGPPIRVTLSMDYYKGDRSMRESGFDVSFRFGPYGADAHHYAPVCLNSLLYKTEKDLEAMSVLLGRTQDAARWSARARERSEEMTQYSWDATRGEFFDYNFETRRRSSYEYATTFYPLWAELATESQARAVAQNLSRFAQPGGIVTSRKESGAQWDYPYGWAPLQLLAVEGLRRYGYNSEADAVSLNFLRMVLENFRRDHAIREKYNVVSRSSETRVEAGYTTNEIGFGWTNGVFLELLNELSPPSKARLSVME
jgi:alpha,alpha-trehalase